MPTAGAVHYGDGMKVIGASDGLPTGEWGVSLGAITHWRARTIHINSDTVANVAHVTTGKGEYNYAAGGAGVVAGAIVAGPLGALAGGLLPKAFKGTQVEFVVDFHDGRRLRAKGTLQEYDKLVKWSMKGPNALLAAAERAEEEESVRVLATEDDRDRLRREVAEERAAKRSPEAKAERKARIAAVRAQKLPMKESLRLIMEIEDDYR